MMPPSEYSNFHYKEYTLSRLSYFFKRISLPNDGLHIEMWSRWLAPCRPFLVVMVMSRSFLVCNNMLIRVGVRYRRWYLGTGTGTWELARYRYGYRYMIFQKYLGTGTGTGTHEKYLGTGTGTLYYGVTKNHTCFQILIPCVYLSSYVYIFSNFL